VKGTAHPRRLLLCLVLVPALLAGLGAGPEEEALTLALGKLLRAFDGLSRVTQ